MARETEVTPDRARLIPAAAREDQLHGAHETLARQAIARFIRHRPAVIGLAIIVVFVALAVLAPIIATHDPTDLDLRSIRQSPSSEHYLGTDTVGYDVWSRLVHGARTSLLVGFVAVTISVLIGALLGIVSGYYGGTIDQVIGRATDTILSLPSILIVAIFVSVIGPTLQSVVLVIALLSWPRITRIVRGQYLVLREADFVTAAKVIGAGDWGHHDSPPAAQHSWADERRRDVLHGSSDSP